MPAPPQRPDASQPKKVNELKLRGVRCWLALQSKEYQALPLYGVQEDDDMISCFVEAVEGEAFRILVQYDGCSAARSERLHLGGKCVLYSWPEAGEWGTRSYTWGYDSHREKRALTFAKPTTSNDDEDPSIVKDAAKLADFGVVEMKIIQLASLKIHNKEGSGSGSDSGSSSGSNGSEPPPCIIHEQSKKAIGHLDARLGDRLGDREPNLNRIDSVDDPDVKPWIFRFVCLSRLGLQLKGFLPHEESQEHLERERQNKKRTQEQAILDARESQLLEEVERIKRRRVTLDAQVSGSSQAGGSSSSQVNVKPEPDRVPFDFKNGGRSMDDPLVIDD